MRIIIGLALVALVSARPMGDMGDDMDMDHMWGVLDDMMGDHKMGGGGGGGGGSAIDKMWGVLAGMHDKAAGKGRAGDRMKGGDDMSSMEQFLKSFMDKKDGAKGDMDPMWGVLAGMHDKQKGGMMGGMGGDKDITDLLELFGGMKDKKQGGSMGGDKDITDLLELFGGMKDRMGGDDMGHKGGDGDKEQMKKLFAMMVQHLMESGDFEGAMKLMEWHKKEMEKKHGDMDDMDPKEKEIKTKIFGVMLMHKMMKGDLDGFFELMIQKQIKMNAMMGRRTSEAEMYEFADEIFKKLAEHKMQANDQEGLKKLMMWGEKKMKEKAAGMSEKDMVKGMFIKIIAMFKLKEGDVEGVKKMMDWVKAAKDYDMSGKKNEMVLEGLYGLAMSQGKMSEREMEEQLPVVFMLLDKLDEFKDSMMHHQFLHIVDGSLGKPKGGDQMDMDMLKKMMGHD